MALAGLNLDLLRADWRDECHMWIYEKKLQYPVRVSKCDPRVAKYLVEQYGGADGELSAALRYLNQRYSIPDKVVGLLTDIGTEEFAHLEMIATMIYKLTKDASPQEWRRPVSARITRTTITRYTTTMPQVYLGRRLISRPRGIHRRSLRGYRG